MHTRGPWHVGTGNGAGLVFSGGGRMRLESHGTTLYPLCSVLGGWDESEDEANAVLIASAPDLLGMLELALKYVDHPDVKAMSFALPAECVADRMRALIAKAKGE